jgi:tRNA-2-methylthio-N6-dimethylallyladenosine synthase
MVREAIPGVAITTDIIVGFPGETEDDFGATLEVVEEVRYDAAYTFQYSPRPGTVASDLPGHLPKDVVQRRYDRLTEMQEAISSEQNRATVGRIQEVLVEGPSKKDPSRLTGRTRTNKLVHFQGSDLGILDGSLRDVVIGRAHPHFLEGHLAQEEAPSRRVSLPLVGAAKGCAPGA